MPTWGKRLPEGVVPWEWDLAVRYKRGAIYMPHLQRVLANPDRWAADPGELRHERLSHEDGHALTGSVHDIHERSNLAVARAEHRAFRAGAEHHVPDAILEQAIRDDEGDVGRLAYLTEVTIAWMRRRVDLFWARHPERRRWRR